MNTLQICILSVVQGIAEFLPISSSGHLVVLSAVMHGGNTDALDVADVNVVLHVGTLLSILFFYWQRIWQLLGEDRRVVGLLIAASIPAVIVGFPIKKWGSQAILSNPMLAGFMLIVTGLLLLWLSRRQEGTREYHRLTMSQALTIGAGQAFAILPGISRSGTTIAAGVGLGLTRHAAATFSFLMAIPVIGGAGLLELKDMMDSGWQTTTSLPNLLLGMVLAFAVGLVALNWLLRCLQSGRIQWFAFWCIPLGVGVVIWRLIC